MWRSRYTRVGGGTKGSAGGICFESGRAVLVNCLIAQNSSDYGGGISVSDAARPELINCTIADNTAIYGGGGGVHAQFFGSPVLKNCIVRGNTAPAGAGQIGIGYAARDLDDGESAVASVSVFYSNVQGGSTGIAISALSADSGYVWGEGNIDGDAAFVDAWTGDYRLTMASKGREVGLNAAVANVLTDLAGSNRLVGNVDMGAYEYTIYAPAATATAAPLLTSVSFSTGASGSGSFTLRGSYESGDLAGQDVRVQIGPFEQVMAAGSGSWMTMGSMAMYRGSGDGVTMALFNGNSETFMIMGRTGDLDALMGSVAVAVAFGSF